MAPIKNRDVKERDSRLRLSPLYFLRNGNQFQNSNGSSGSGELWLTQPNKWEENDHFRTEYRSTNVEKGGI